MEINIYGNINAERVEINLTPVTEKIKRQTVFVVNPKTRKAAQEVKLSGTFSQWLNEFWPLVDGSKKAPAIGKLQALYKRAVLPEEAVTTLNLNPKRNENR